MARILIGWELGGGRGHVEKLRPIANVLREAGHQVLFAVRDPSVFEGEQVVFQAPRFSNRHRKSFLARSYTDILRRNGFAEVGQLMKNIERWEAMIIQHAVDLVIAEHAPTLCLTAIGFCPCIVVGTGFTVPPGRGLGFPALTTGIPPSDTDTRTLSVVNDVQCIRRRPELKVLGELFSSFPQHLGVIPELDPYAEHRQENMLYAPISPVPNVAPAPDSDSLFLYLRGNDSRLAELAKIIQDRGLSGFGHFRAPLRQNIEFGSRFKVLAEPASLQTIFSEARLIIHHGGIGLMQAALFAGCPQLTLPNHLEQRLNGSALIKFKCGRAVGREVPNSELANTLSEVLEHSHYRENARSTALGLHCRAYPNQLSKIEYSCRLRLSQSSNCEQPSASTEETARTPNTRSSTSRKVFEIGLGGVFSQEISACLRRRGLRGISEIAEAQSGQFLDALREKKVSAHLRIVDFAASCLATSYQMVDEAFPGSRFILPVIEEEEWFDRYVQTYHQQPSPPSTAFHALYRVLQFGALTPLGNEEAYLRAYGAHLRDVLSHFRGRPEALLILDVSRNSIQSDIDRFLGSSR